MLVCVWVRAEIETKYCTELARYTQPSRDVYVTHGDVSHRPLPPSRCRSAPPRSPSCCLSRSLRPIRFCVAASSRPTRRRQRRSRGLRRKERSHQLQNKLLHTVAVIQYYCFSLPREVSNKESTHRISRAQQLTQSQWALLSVDRSRRVSAVISLFLLLDTVYNRYLKFMNDK